jgi:ubiquitin-like 1-activating enzyme E1 B
VVGAGGIGCELVKSLALANFDNITILDFDTVSLSNLSRQFFYTESDIGQTKSSALARNAQRLYPQLKLRSLFMDVLSNDFSLVFVEQFDFVFCALDNVAARKRVNKICVLTRIPLIDCGSSGKFAQSVPVLAFQSACYDCSPAVAPGGPKVTCTIRSTPENFEHCAAWAFHLFDSVYSESGSTDIIEVDDSGSIFHDVFITKVIEQRDNEDLWKSRAPPSPIDISAERNSEPMTRPTDIWSDPESKSIFLYASDLLQKPSVFDKDNDLHLAFVTAAANLRAKSYHIDKRSSMFDVKGLVAVVAPALATTNSIISGIAVTQMIRIINGEVNVRSVWLVHERLGPRLTSNVLEKPNAFCPVCGCELWEVICIFQETRLSNIG